MLYAVLSVAPINLHGRDDRDQERLADLLGDVANLLGPGQRLRLLIDNRSVTARDELARLASRQVPRSRRQLEYTDRRRAWMEAKLSDARVARTAFYVVIGEMPGLGLNRVLAGAARRDSFRATVDEVGDRLEAMGLDYTVLDGDATRALLASHGVLCPAPPQEALEGVYVAHEDASAEASAEEGGATSDAGHWERTLYALRVPDQTMPGWVGKLATLPFQSRVSIDIEGLNPDAELRRLDGLQTYIAGINDDREAQTGASSVQMNAQQREYRRVMDDMADPSVKIHKLGVYLTVTAPTKEALAGNVARAAAALRAARCQVGWGLGDQARLRTATLPVVSDPGHNYRALTGTVGRCFPFSRLSPGDDTGMPLGRTPDKREQFLLDLDADDISTQQVAIAGVPGCQPAGARVLLASGEWATVEQVRVGDMVMSPQQDGSMRPARVLRTASYDNQIIYRVQTKGQRTPRGYLCSGDHILPVLSDYGPAGTPHARALRHIHRLFELTVTDYLAQGPSFKDRARIFTPAAYDLPPQEYAIDPYVMGCMIGDGCLTGSTYNPTFTSCTPKITERMVAAGAMFGKAQSRRDAAGTLSYYAVGAFSTALKASEVHGRNSYTHRIPREYMIGSLDQRLQILAGLVDTDGEHDAFTSMSRGLAEDFAHLIFSVGGMASVKEHATRCNGKPFMSYRVHYSIGECPIPVALVYKVQKARDMAWKNHRNHKFTVEPIGIGTVYGFTLDSESNWYVTDDWLVTHNSGKTLLTLEMALQTYLEGNSVFISDSSGSYAPLCVFLDGSYVTPLDHETQPCINPWDFMDTRALVRFHRSILRQSDPSASLSWWQARELGQAIRATKEDHEAAPCESRLIERLRAIDVADAGREVERDNLIAGLADYTSNGDYATLADRPTSPWIDLANPFLIFDTSLLGDAMVPGYYIVEALEEWRAGRHGGKRRPDGRAVMECLVIDEGWAVIEADPEYLERIGRTSRHLNRRVIFATQNLSDMIDNPKAAKLFSAIPVVILFNVTDERAGQDAGLGWMGRTLRLTTREVEQLGGLKTIRGKHAQAFVVIRSEKASERRRGRVDIELCPDDLALFKSHKGERDEREAAVAAHGGSLWDAVKALVDGEKEAVAV